MQITVNGKQEEIPEGTVLDLLKHKDWEPQMVAVELNADLLERDALATTTLKEGDRVECIFYMGGGQGAVDVTTLIGNTPMVRLNRIPEEGSADIYVKLEHLNPGGSVKDRICLNMIDEAERQGKLKPGSTMVEPTSGNTGIGLALISAVRGYKLILVMPESMSMERASLLSSYGAQLVLTPAWEGMRGSITEAENIVSQNPTFMMPDQFSNPANPAMHRRTTGPEIRDALDGNIDAFVAAVGTGGTITGVGEVLKKHDPKIHIVAVEPAASPVLAGGKAGLTGIQGIGASFVPSVLNKDSYDELSAVTDEDAYAMTLRLTREEGLLVGVSAGANVFASLQVAYGVGTRVSLPSGFGTSLARAR